MFIVREKVKMIVGDFILILDKKGICVLVVDFD